VWQSFRAGLTGKLTQISMGFFNAPSGAATLDVFQGAGISGPILQTQPITLSQTAPAEFAIWAVNVPVVAGQIYTFRFTPTSDGTFPDPYGVASAQDSYGAGVLGFGSPAGSGPSEFDAVFCTYVTP
jgi:hypothetical protein